MPTTEAQRRAIANYKAKHVDEIKAYKRQYYLANQERLKQYGKEYYRKSTAKVAESVAMVIAGRAATQNESTEAAE